MAAGVSLTYGNNWVVAYASSASAGFTLPYDLWPGATEPNRSKPFIPRRLIWIAGDAAVAGNKVIIQDNSGVNIVEFTATGADYEPPQDWKRAYAESGPIGAIITQFDAGLLYVMW